tara:strand:+ start:129 stop:701 length:573 start_codon:yes stop_codon:yes gene_type:complete
MHFEPKWKSLIVQSKDPVFTPEQCQDIINMGRSQKKETAKLINEDGTVNTDIRISNVSWIPFSKLPPMYERLKNFIYTVNNNHFGYDGICLNETAQYTEYSKGCFYNWHTDSALSGDREPPVRKISMTCLLSHESEFEGGDLQLINEKSNIKLKQGHAIFFSSFIRHRVTPIEKGNRKSLVVWFGGPSFK